MKIKIIVHAILERIGLRFLDWAGTEIVIYPVHMKLYEAEIRQLCDEEARDLLHTDDLLGSHYFRARRIMTKMRRNHPDLSVRDLWRAVDMIFDYEELK